MGQDYLDGRALGEAAETGLSDGMGGVLNRSARAAKGFRAKEIP